MATAWSHMTIVWLHYEIAWVQCEVIWLQYEVTWLHYEITWQHTTLTRLEWYCETKKVRILYSGGKHFFPWSFMAWRSWKQMEAMEVRCSPNHPLFSRRSCVCGCCSSNLWKRDVHVCVCVCVCDFKSMDQCWTTHLFEMEVSRISKHFSLHLFGLPGNWESGMLFSLSISVTNTSALCVRVCEGGWERICMCESVWEGMCESTCVRVWDSLVPRPIFR